MIAEVTGTVEKGSLKLDRALPFPDHTRVKLTVEALEPEDRSLAAWTRLQRLIDEKPLAGLAGRFSREQLHERD
jgi:hypothetical protein